jgi:hypothetical protein
VGGKIKMDLDWHRLWDVNWIQLTEDGIQCWVFVIMVMNFWGLL